MKWPTCFVWWSKRRPKPNGALKGDLGSRILSDWRSFGFRHSTRYASAWPGRRGSLARHGDCLPFTRLRGLEAREYTPAMPRCLLWEQELRSQERALAIVGRSWDDRDMTAGQTFSVCGGVCMRVLAVMLVLGIVTAPVPLNAFTGPSADNRSEKSCGSCECDPHGHLDRRSPGEPEASSFLRQSRPGIPVDEPCCPDGCNHCSSLCCAGVTMGIAPSVASVDFLFAASPVPAAGTAVSSIELTDVFHPPRT